MTSPAAKSDVVSTESMREFLFSNPRFPGWSNDLTKIRAGVEIEYLIVNADNPQDVMRKKQYREFLHRIERRGFTCRPNLSSMDRRSLDRPPGYIVVEPDFAYHVLEIALPPRQSLSEIEHLADEVITLVDQALAEVGCRRLESGAFETALSNFDVVGLPRLANFAELLRLAAGPEQLASSYFLPDFGAHFAATHIHLNVCDSESALSMLPALYDLEWAAHVIFSRCQRFRDQKCGNARALVYGTTFPNSYALVHVPSRIPSTLEELAELYRQSTPVLFPLDAFGGVKDMTIIRPRSFGSFEFRSACSAPRPKDLTNITTFRVAQVAYAQMFLDSPIGPEGWQRQAVFALAKGSKPDPITLDAIFRSCERFKTVADHLPSQWSGSISTICQQILNVAEALMRG